VIANWQRPSDLVITTSLGPGPGKWPGRSPSVTARLYGSIMLERWFDYSLDHKPVRLSCHPDGTIQTALSRGTIQRHYPDALSRRTIQTHYPDALSRRTIQTALASNRSNNCLSTIETSASSSAVITSQRSVSSLTRSWLKLDHALMNAIRYLYKKQ
jgi:hypothetical protein